LFTISLPQRRGFTFSLPFVYRDSALPIMDLAGGFGDIEFGHEPDVGPTLGAELDKLLNRFLIFHLTFPGPNGGPGLAHPNGPLPFEGAEARSNGHG
jgi:hypothetical protein